VRDCPFVAMMTSNRADKGGEKQGYNGETPFKGSPSGFRATNISSQNGTRGSFDCGRISSVWVSGYYFDEKVGGSSRKYAVVSGPDGPFGDARRTRWMSSTLRILSIDRGTSKQSPSLVRR